MSSTTDCDLRVLEVTLAPDSTRDFFLFHMSYFKIKPQFRGINLFFPPVGSGAAWALL